MTSPVSRQDRLVGGLYGSLVGDALCLAPHWIYDPAEIRDRFGNFRHFADPSSNPYHSTKQAGDFTHYGDQVICLMQSISVSEGFSRKIFEEEWHAMWPSYEDYIDRATRNTLQNGHSDSRELSGASRIAPLLVALRDEPEEALLQAATEQTALSHGHPDAIDAAKFFALLARSLVDGAGWDESWERAEGATYPSLDVAALMGKARAEITEDPAEALERLGRACSVDVAFPATVYLLLRYRSRLDRALEENALAGGDSAARGLLIGLVLGSLHGVGHLPEHWIQELHAHTVVAEWLESLGVHPEV